MDKTIYNTKSKESHFFLFKQLLKVRLLADLKRSYLGWSWLLILPFFSILTWIFMKGAGILDPGFVGLPYTAFVLLSTTLWAGFFDSYKNCSSLLQTYGKLLLVNRLPIMLIIFTETVVSFIRFAIPFAIVIAYFIIMQIPFSIYGLLFPLIYFPLILFGVSIGLITSLLNSVAKDFTYLMDNFMRILMLLSPVVYSAEISKGLLSSLIKYNPITYLLSSAREILIFGNLYEPTISIICMLVVILTFVAVTRFFVNNASRILERGLLN